MSNQVAFIDTSWLSTISLFGDKIGVAKSPGITLTVHLIDGRRPAATPTGCSTSSPPPEVATAVLANFKQVVKDKPVRIHPIVSQLVDPAVLEKMKVRAVGEAEQKKM